MKKYFLLFAVIMLFFTGCKSSFEPVMITLPIDESVPTAEQLDLNLKINPKDVDTFGVKLPFFAERWNELMQTIVMEDVKLHEWKLAYRESEIAFIHNLLVNFSVNGTIDYNTYEISTIQVDFSLKEKYKYKIHAACSGVIFGLNQSAKIELIEQIIEELHLKPQIEELKYKKASTTIDGIKYDFRSNEKKGTFSATLL